MLKLLLDLAKTNQCLNFLQKIHFLLYCYVNVSDQLINPPLLKMKKIIIALSFAAASLTALTASAQDAAQIKDLSLKACEAQSAQMPEEQRELVMKICTCTVENTDYDVLLEKSVAGDTASVQADALAVAQKCQAEHS